MRLSLVKRPLPAAFLYFRCWPIADFSEGRETTQRWRYLAIAEHSSKKGGPSYDEPLNTPLGGRRIQGGAISPT